MSVGCKALLDSAKSCIKSLGDPTDEAHRELNESLARSAVVQAYYGAYHACLRFAKQRGFKKYVFDPPVFGGVHEKLWTWFERNGFPDISDAGNRLKVRRNFCSYKIHLDLQFEPSLAVMESYLLFYIATSAKSDWEMTQPTLEL